VLPKLKKGYSMGSCFGSLSAEFEHNLKIQTSEGRHRLTACDK